MDQIYHHPTSGPAGTDQISIQLYSKYKLTEDIKAELAHHLTNKLPKPKGNKLLLIGPKIGITAKLLEPLCSQIDIVAEQQYMPILEATFVKNQDIEYTYYRQGFIGQKHLVKKHQQGACKINVIQISKYKDHVDRNSHYDIILLQNVIVHPQINILKQLMRLRHDVLITMIVPGKLEHKNLFELISGIEQNILQVFYQQAIHERTEYIRYVTGRRQEINVWQIFVWVRKNVQDVREDLKKVESILQEEVKKNKVTEDALLKAPGVQFHETQIYTDKFIDMHYGQTEYFGVKNFPLHCVEKVVAVAKQQNITGRVLDVGCAVGRSTIEFGRHFDSVVGVERSESFLKAAKEIQAERFPDLSNKIQYLQGDACNLDSSLGKFDVVFAGNVIDRLQEPERFLRNIYNFMNPKSLLVITSPYSWSQEFTKKDKWIGGKQVNDKDVSSNEQITQILSELGMKEVRTAEDIRFVIQQNHWVYQHYSSQALYWVKEA